LQVDHQQADGNTDLHRGEADSRRVVHRLEHIGDERLQLIVERLHGLGNLAEHSVGRLINASDGHELDLSPASPPCKGGAGGGSTPDWIRGRSYKFNPPLNPLPAREGQSLGDWPPRPQRLGERALVEIIELSPDRKSVRQLADADGKPFEA